MTFVAFSAESIFTNYENGPRDAVTRNAAFAQQKKAIENAASSQ